MLEYALEEKITADALIDVLTRYTLGERRPVNDRNRIEKMLAHANILVTVRDQGKLIGVARSLTDYSFCTYLSDLAVDENYQRQGIGRELIRRTKLAAPQAKLILLSAPKAVNYYPRIGMTKWEQTFTLDDVDALR